MYTAWLMHAYVHASYTHMQIGNKEEVMYFFTNSDQDRDDWIEAFRIGITCLYSTSTKYMYKGLSSYICRVYNIITV